MTSEIVQCLQQVDRERERREQEPGLAARVHQVKLFQQRRFEATYRDLALLPRYRDAVRFFLLDLYGPLEFRQRDREFARIVPKIEAFFPSAVRSTVLTLVRLHALSEKFDTEMALSITDGPLNAAEYVRAWQDVGREARRRDQLKLALALGTALDFHTRHRWLTRTLKLMRAPARAAGLCAMQAFLERGMTAFHGMQGATEFLSIIETRESSLIDALFSGDGKFIQVEPESKYFPSSAF